MLFSTWNLDHLVERSRSVVPGIITALKVVIFLISIRRNHIAYFFKGTKTSRQKVNTDYFYSLLFTRSVWLVSP